MADLKTNFPQRVQKVLGQRFELVVVRALAQKQKVHVAVGREQSAPVAAEPDQRDAARHLRFAYSDRTPQELREAVRRLALAFEDT